MSLTLKTINEKLRLSASEKNEKREAFDKQLGLFLQKPFFFGTPSSKSTNTQSPKTQTNSDILVEDTTPNVSPQPTPKASSSSTNEESSTEEIQSTIIENINLASSQMSETSTTHTFIKPNLRINTENVEEDENFQKQNLLTKNINTMLSIISQNSFDNSPGHATPPPQIINQPSLLLSKQAIQANQTVKVSQTATNTTAIVSEETVSNFPIVFYGMIFNVEGSSYSAVEKPSIT